MVLCVPILKNLMVVRSTNEREYIMMSVSPVTLRRDLHVKFSGISGSIYPKVPKYWDTQK